MVTDELYISFTLAGERYALASAGVKEVVPAAETTPVPLAPDDVSGVVNLRNDVVTIIDLRKRFNLPNSGSSEGASFIILENNDALIGIAVDNVDAVISISPEQLSLPPEHPSGQMMRYVDWVARLERQLIVILSSEKLFSFEDRVVASVHKSSATAA